MVLPIRRLSEFILRSGSIDNRFGGSDSAAEGARIHRYLQKQGGMPTGLRCGWRWKEKWTGSLISWRDGPTGWWRDPCP